MADLLIYEAAQRRLIWKGRESYLRHRERVILDLLLRHRGEWVSAERVAAALWPGLCPDGWRDAVAAYCSTLAAQLVGTSARIARSRDYHVTLLGYRVEGQIGTDAGQPDLEAAARSVT